MGLLGDSNNVASLVNQQKVLPDAIKTDGFFRDPGYNEDATKLELQLKHY